MRTLAVFFILVAALIETGCGGSVPHAHVKCSTNDFRNDTDGVLSDADLKTAWAHAQWTIASGYWVINALRCGENIPCEFHPPEPKANTVNPECFGVKGVHGTVYGGHYGVTDDGHNIAIDIDIGHDKAWAYASYEMENSIACYRLSGFDCGDR